MALRTIPIRRVGNRNNLFMGGDRELVMVSALLATVLIFASHDWTAFFFGISAWFTSIWIFRKMAKADPKMRLVYLRNRRYRLYYPPRATPFRSNTPTQEKQYK